MRRKFKDGTGSKKSFLKTVMPVGTILGTGKFVSKKIKENKEAKKSRNPNPKTPKMMDAKKEKKISFSSSGRGDQKNNKNGGKKQ
jgi:hypothetical protein